MTLSGTLTGPLICLDFIDPVYSLEFPWIPFVHTQCCCNLISKFIFYIWIQYSIEAKRVGGILSRFWCLFCSDVVIWYVSLVTFIINQRPVIWSNVTAWVPTIIYLLIFVTGICPKILYIRIHQLHICTSWQT